MKFPDKLQNKLNSRVENKALRQLGLQSGLVDFSSNDYLGFAQSQAIFDATHQFLIDKKIKINGATGSRLLSGNHVLYDEVEQQVSVFHESEAALIFNSGYDANLGFFASVPQRGDIIFYDELIHASIRDGIQLSNAKSYRFKHNDLNDLDELLKRVQQNDLEIYVVTEAVFSMDGDSPDLVKMSELINKHNAYFVVDEAHAIGVFHKGLVQDLGIEHEVFARIITFGKALGCHGAAILGGTKLRQYLINFSRSFIYTTGLSPHALATIKIAYNHLNVGSSLPSRETGAVENSQQKLQENIQFFKSELERLELKKRFIKSNSAIHCCIVKGNTKVKEIAIQMQQKGFEVKPILSPTISEGEERLRFCLHSYNTNEEITKVLMLLSTFVT